MKEKSQTPRELYNKLNKKFSLDLEDREIRTQQYHENEQFSAIPKDHIESLISYIDSLIVANFTPRSYDTVQEKEYIAKVVKRVANCTLEERENTPEYINRLYWLNNAPQDIKQSLEEDGYTSLENPEIYLPLVNAITRDRGELIGNYVLSTISFVDKYASDREVDSPKAKDNSESESKQRKTVTWVDKVASKNSTDNLLQ